MPRLPSRAELLARYDYNPETGTITRRDNGKPAFATPMKGEGYLRGKIGRDCFRAHRVAWKMAYGTEPLEIDHINRNPADNRLCNLRAVTHRENQRNRGLPKNSTSGHCGVNWNKRDRRWRAVIAADGRRVFVGAYVNKAEAIAARKQAELRYWRSSNGR
jgi:hypothetical protein